MADHPRCRNAVRGACAREDMRLKSETPDAWVFQCSGCQLVQVVSKDGVRERSRAAISARTRQQQADIIRRQEARRKYFT